MHLARLLCQGAFHVAEICDVLQAPQSTVSRNLKILADSGLVDGRREGRIRWYRWGAVLGPAERDLKRWLEMHGPPLSEDAGHRLAAVWDERRERTARFFDGVDPAEHGAAWLGSPDCLPYLVAAVRQGSTVLDLGTGSGRLLPHLRERAGGIIGVDASPRMLEAARSRVQSEGLDVDLRLGDFAHLPLHDAECDAVIANMVLHHLPEPAQVLTEIRRVLKPGGRFLVGDFLPHDHEWMRETLADQWLGIAPSDLTDWLAEAGFGRVDVQPLPPNRPDAPGVFVAIAARDR